MAALVLQNIMRGSAKMDSVIGVETCSGSYWGIYAGFLAIAVLMCLYGVIVAKSEFKEKKRIGYNFAKGDVQWGTKITIILIAVSMTGGLLAAIVGIGGGVVYSPLFLELGIPPKATSATAMFLVLYTSLANTI